MALYGNRVNQGTQSGFASFQTFGSSNETSTEELLTLARLQGGAIGQIADELSHPNRKILSSIGQGFKNAFRGFVDVISTPSHVVAGILSPELTVKEAMEQNKSVSSVIFGDTNIFSKDGTPSTLEKIGDFIVRLPVDVMTDPLTYLTFGASAGTLGLKSLPKVTLGKNAAKQIGKEGVDGVVSKALSDQGSDLYKYLKTYERQTKGTFSIENQIKNGKMLESTKKDLIAKGLGKGEIDMSEKILKGMIKESIEAPLNPDMAKKAISKILEANPALTTTYLDKGGIKYFGKSILSAQRIDAVTKLIPGMTYLDNATLPFRQRITAPFDPALVKSDKGYIRLPEEYVNMRTKLRNIKDAKGVDLMRKLSNVQTKLNLSQNEMDIVTAAINTKKIPTDPRLAQAYLDFIGIDKENLDLLRKSGVQIANQEGHVGLITVPTSTKGVRMNGQLASTVGAAQEASYAKLLPIADKPIVDMSPEVAGLLDNASLPDDVLSNVRQSRNIDEINSAVGKEIETKLKSLKATGMTTEEALKDKSVQSLQKLQDDLTKAYEQSPLIGKMGQGSLKGLTEIDKAQFAELGLSEGEGRFFIDNQDKIYKRVATTAQELRDAGFDGFDTNLFTAATVRGMQNIQQAMGQHFSEGLVRNFGKKASEAPESWVSLGSAIIDDKVTKVFGEINPFTQAGEEIVFHPAIAKDFENMLKGLTGDEVTEGFWKSYDKILSYWKASVTTIFPMFHGRNAISNVFLNMLDLGYEAIDPRNHMLSMSIIKDDRTLNSIVKRMAGTGDDALKATDEYAKLINKEVFTDATGYSWKLGELRDAIRKNDVAFNPNITGFLDVRNDRAGLAKFFGVGQTKKQQALQAINPLNQEQFLATKGGREVGRLVEEQSRLINFISNLRKTGDVEHAALRTKQFLFDYANLTPFEKNVMRRLVPFYCVPEETEALTRDGWKLHHDIKEGDEILTVNTATQEYEWQPVLEKFVAPFNDYLTSIKSKRYSLDATLNHRWVIEDHKGDTKIKKGFELNSGDKIKTSFKYLSSESRWTEDDARLLGWLLTDGYFRKRGNHIEAMIYQSPKKFLKEVIEIAGGKPRKPHPDTGVVCVPVLKERVERIKEFLSRSKESDNWTDFVGQLGKKELEAMYDAMYKADGTTSILRHQDYFACELNGVGETFQMIATLLGKRAIKSAKGYYISNWDKMGVKDMWKEYYLYNGNVWCPRTENGTWVMRQRGFVTATGNTFTRKNLELQAKTLMTSPGRISAQIKTVQTIGTAMGGQQLTQEEQKLMPPWLKNSINLKRKRADGTFEVLTGFGTPIEQPFQQFGGSQFEGSLSPLIKFPLEKLTGYNFFRGKPTSQVIDAEDYKLAPAPIKDFIGYVEYEGTTSTGKKFTRSVALRPDRLHSLNNLPFVGRVMNTLGNITDDDIDGGLRTLQGITGIRADNIDFERQQQIQEQEILDSLEKLLNDAGVRGQFTKFYTRKNTVVTEN